MTRKRQERNRGRINATHHLENIEAFAELWPEEDFIFLPDAKDKLVYAI